MERALTYVAAVLFGGAAFALLSWLRAWQARRERVARSRARHEHQKERIGTSRDVLELCDDGERVVLRGTLRLAGSNRPSDVLGGADDWPAAATIHFQRAGEGAQRSASWQAEGLLLELSDGLVELRGRLRVLAGDAEWYDWPLEPLFRRVAERLTGRAPARLLDLRGLHVGARVDVAGVLRRMTGSGVSYRSVPARHRLVPGAERSGSLPAVSHRPPVSGATATRRSVAALAAACLLPPLFLVALADHACRHDAMCEQFGRCSLTLFGEAPLSCGVASSEDCLHIAGCLGAGCAGRGGFCVPTAGAGPR